jgi:hypothetical protein
MSKQLKLSRNDIRERYKQTPDVVVREFQQAMANKDRATRRLYWTALNKLLFDLANRDDYVANTSIR